VFVNKESVLHRWKQVESKTWFIQCGMVDMSVYTHAQQNDTKHKKPAVE